MLRKDGRGIATSKLNKKIIETSLLYQRSGVHIQIFQRIIEPYSPEPTSGQQIHRTSQINGYHASIVPPTIFYVLLQGRGEVAISEHFSKIGQQ